MRAVVVVSLNHYRVRLLPLRPPPWDETPRHHTRLIALRSPSRSRSAGHVGGVITLRRPDHGLNHTWNHTPVASATCAPVLTLQIPALHRGSRSDPHETGISWPRRARELTRRPGPRGSLLAEGIPAGTGERPSTRGDGSASRRPSPVARGHLAPSWPGRPGRQEPPGLRVRRTPRVRSSISIDVVSIATIR